MKTDWVLTTLDFYPQHSDRRRAFALYYFGTLLAVWTVVGHTVLGFEQSWAQPVVGVVSALSVQLFLDWIDARATGRPPRFTAGLAGFMTTALPAVISGLAVAMLLYPNRLLWPIAFGAAFAIASKLIFRAPVGDSTQHIFNPSNLGIIATLVLFPWVGVAPPYQFTENAEGIWNWIIPGIILATGVIVHGFCTGRLPLVLTWFAGFLGQGMLRAAYLGTPVMVPFAPMTSAAFVLFSLYMIPDPATTPLSVRGQIAFGLSVAAVYGLLQVYHQVYGLFGALVFVSAVRGVGLYALSALKRARLPAGARESQ